MKSNPVVFPFKPFSRLDARLQKQSYADIETDLATLSVLLPKKIFHNVLSHGKTIEEKIFSIFVNPQIRFGEKSDITQLKKYWLDRISYFTSKKKRLECTILGFPGKAPVPIKTRREMPDFGELTSLHRLYELTRHIRRTYAPGARITIITEGLLGTGIGLSMREAVAYEKYLQKLIKYLHWNGSLRTVPLGKMQKNPAYKKILRSEIRKFRDVFNKKDKQFLAKYTAAYASIFHLVSTRGNADQTVRDAYKAHPKTAQGKRLRTAIAHKAHKATIGYFATLSVRDKLKFLETTVPHFLALTVSPKPYRLSFQLVPATVTLLAHHGIPFGDIIQYRQELLTSQKPYIRVFLTKDTDREPFLYLSYKT